MEGDRRRRAVEGVPHVECRQDVQTGQMGDRVRMVEARPEGDQRAPVVPGQREPGVPQPACQGDDVVRHGPLGIGVGAVLARLVAVAVAAQVGADHGVVDRQVRRDMAPHQVGLREAVQQDHGRAGPSHGHVEGHVLGDGHALVLESGDGGSHGGALFGRTASGRHRCPGPGRR